VTSPRARLGRAVFEAYLLVACVLTGVVGFVAPATRARSIVTTFPGWAQTAWYAGLLLGGIVAIAGITVGSILGSLVERAAMLTLAGMCLSFGVASIAYAGPPAITGAMMLLAFAGACVVRACQITGDLTALRTELQRRTASDP
jgi:hypothetical protein